MPASNDRAAAQATIQSTAQSDATPTTAEGLSTPLSDERVQEFLQQNDDFLQRHPDLLDCLHIPHASGSAVSLVEKQVSVLRERNMDMRHRLTSLTTHARENDKLFEQTSALVLALLDANSIDELHTLFTETMVNEFAVEHACMILYGEESNDKGCRIQTRASADAGIGSLFKGNKAVCGTLRAQELKFLFPDGGDVGSAAMMPLNNKNELGLIAVGSSDANRYNSTVGTLFLSHIADVITRLIPHLQHKAD